MGTDRPRGTLTRRRLLGGATGLALASVSPTLAGGQETTTNQEDDTLRFALDQRPEGFDPLITDDSTTAQVATLVFGGLYIYGQSTGLIPYLAADEPTIENDRRRYVVHLRDDARFQNGNAVTPDDVRYSFDIAREHAAEDDPLVTMLDDVRTADRTIRFDLTEPYAPFPHVLTLDVVPEDVREVDPERFDTQRPIGAGPFRIVTRRPDEPVHLERWADYWGTPRPNLASVELPVVEAPTTRLATLQAGENDVIEPIPPELYSDVEALSDATIVERPMMHYVHLAFNCRAGPTADPVVREAVDFSVALDQAVAEFVEPAGVRMYSPLPPPLANDWQMPVVEWRATPHPKNVADARRLFEQAAVPSDWSATIAVPEDDLLQQLALTVANGLKEAGYGGTVEPLDDESFQEVRLSGDPEAYDMYIDRWSALPDPDAFTYPLFGQAAEGVTNGTYYRNDEVEGKLSTARRAVGRAERRDLYASAISTILSDRAHLPIFDDRHTFAVRDAVREFRAHPVESFQLVSDSNNVSVER